MITKTISLIIIQFLLCNFYCNCNDIHANNLFNKNIQGLLPFNLDSLNSLNDCDKLEVIKRQINNINSSLFLKSQDSVDEFFNSDAKYDSSYHSTWSMNSNWINRDKEIFSYDTQKRVVKVDFYDYTFDTNDVKYWRFYKIGLYNYDTKNNKVISYTQANPEWESGEKKSGLRFLMTYDSLDRLKEFIVQQYLNNEWINIDKQIEYYNDYGQLEKRLFCYWGESEWYYGIKFLYFYNSKGELDEEYYQTGDGVNWINKFRTMYLYDKSGNMIEKEKKRYIDGEWFDSTKMSISYTQSNKFLKIINYWWKDSIYDVTQIIDFKYDESDNLIEKLTTLDSSGNILNFLKGLYSYDNSNNLILSISQRWNEKWTNEAKAEYYYSTQLNVEEFDSFKKSSFHIIPNPASEYIEISNFNYTVNHMGDELLVIQIYNVFGVQMAVGEHCPDIIGRPLRIDISHFPNGLYFLRITDEVQKFVVLR